MKKLLTCSCVSILFIIIVVVLTAGYFGLFPGVSKVFGSDKPKDLGVKYAQKNYDDYIKKSEAQIIYGQNPDEKDASLSFAGQKDLKTSFTQEEVSARINYSTWEYMPVSDVQLKFNDDGTLEFSGRLREDRLQGFIDSVGTSKYNQSDIQKGLDKIGVLTKNPPLYVKVKPIVKNNKLEVNIYEVEVGRIPVPFEKIGTDPDALLESAANALMQKVPGLNAKSVVFTKGKMNYEGTVPATTYINQ